MKEKIGFGKLPPTSFYENRFYNILTPYSIRRKNLPDKDIAQAHFSTSLEIFLSENVKGIMTIQGNRYILSNCHAFIIPPFIIHSTMLEPGDGNVYVLQISYEAFIPYIDIARLMNESHRELLPREVETAQLNSLQENLNDLIKYDHDIMHCTMILIKVLMRLSTERSETKRNRIPKVDTQLSENIKSIVLWSMMHVRQPIHLQQVADIVGYTKAYFCTWFKKNTGTSYMLYINSLKIDYACEILQETGSIEKACESVGFSNVSYFSQLFKKYRGYTPKNYLRQLQK